PARRARWLSAAAAAGPEAPRTGGPRLLPELAEHGLLPSAPGKLPPEQERRVLVVAVARLLTTVAGTEGPPPGRGDLQWAGAGALELRRRLGRAAADQTPLRVLGSYRRTAVHTDNALAGLVAALAAA